MPGEKEININLLNVLDLIERLEIADQDGGYEKMKAQLAFKKNALSVNFTRNHR